MPSTSNLPGFFLTLEGGEGAGKSTVSRRLIVDLAKKGYKVLYTREPGEGKIGESIREILLHKANTHLSPHAEALLFAADRAQHVAETVLPALKNGFVVICDRYLDSSVAYQGYARDLGVEDIAHLSNWGTDNLEPDLTVLIDIDPAVAIARKFDQDETNRMEMLDTSFHQKVREGFLYLAKSNPKRIVVVDGERTQNKIYDEILELVTKKLTQKVLLSN